jgi:hypothetical protein
LQCTGAADIAGLLERSLSGECPLSAKAAAPGKGDLVF